MQRPKLSENRVLMPFFGLLVPHSYTEEIVWTVTAGAVQVPRGCLCLWKYYADYDFARAKDAKDGRITPTERPLRGEA